MGIRDCSDASYRGFKSNYESYVAAIIGMGVPVSRYIEQLDEMGKLY